MTETPNGFRDGAATAIGSSAPCAMMQNPYRSPQTAGLAPEPSEESAEGPRLPATATVLFGQVPFYGALGTDIAMEWAMPGYSNEVGAVMVVCFFLAGENLTFNMRALCSGPGRLLPRAATVVFCQMAACFAAGWITLLTGRSSIGPGSDRIEIPEFSANLIWIVPLALAPALFIRACGSVDLPRSNRSHLVGRWDRLIAAAAVVLAGAALVPVMTGAFDVRAFVERMGNVVPRELGWAALIVPLTLLALVGQTWRIVLRGAVFGSLWKVIPAALSIAAQALIVGVAVVIAIVDRNPDIGGAIALPLCFFLIPIVRETVIRFAGYRAANLYVERRKARRRAAESASTAVVS